MSVRKIAVVGSLNLDLLTETERFPLPGETIIGQRFGRFMGGKGANQAVAAARLGAEVVLVGAVGDDDFGRQMQAALGAEGVDTRGLRVVAGQTSGLASITVAGAENQIIVVPGANHALTPADVEARADDIARADVVLVQLEIPIDCVWAAAEMARHYRKPLMLNPAPAHRLPEALLRATTLLTPNAHELAASLGLPAETPLAELCAAAPCAVALSRGVEGAYYRAAGSHDLQHQPAFAVTAVDSTGAGDTFNAALAVYWHLGPTQALRHACAAAALSVTRTGAQSGMPHAAELAAFLRSPPGTLSGSRI